MEEGRGDGRAREKKRNEKGGRMWGEGNKDEGTPERQDGG